MSIYSPKELEKRSRNSPFPHLMFAGLYITRKGQAVTRPKDQADGLTGHTTVTPTRPERPIITPAKPERPTVEPDVENKPTTLPTVPVTKPTVTPGTSVTDGKPTTPTVKPDAGLTTTVTPKPEGGGTPVDIGVLGTSALRVPGGVTLTTAPGEVVNPHSAQHVDFPANTAPDRVAEVLLASGFLAHIGADLSPNAGASSEIMLPSTPHLALTFTVGLDGRPACNAYCVGFSKLTAPSAPFVQLRDMFASAASQLNSVWGDIALIFTGNSIVALANFTAEHQGVTAVASFAAPYAIGRATGKGSGSSGPHFHIESVDVKGTLIDPLQFVSVDKRGADAGTTDTMFKALNPSHDLAVIKPLLYARMMALPADRLSYVAILGGVFDVKAVIAARDSLTAAEPSPGRVTLKTI